MSKTFKLIDVQQTNKTERLNKDSECFIEAVLFSASYNHQRSIKLHRTQGGNNYNHYFCLNDQKQNMICLLCLFCANPDNSLEQQSSAEMCQQLIKTKLSIDHKLFAEFANNNKRKTKY